MNPLARAGDFWKRIENPLKRQFPALLVLGLACHVAWPLRRGAPLSWDHPTHLFKAWHFWTEMLPNFRLRGFSHFWGFGFPSGETAPIGEEIWIALFRVVTFGRLTWLQTYSLAMAGLIVLLGLSTYFFTARYFGRLAGVIAASLTLYDPGWMKQGGWLWFMDYGVWPATLGTCLLMLALTGLEDVLEAPIFKRVLVAGAWVAAALVSHALPLVALPLLVGLLLADHWLRGPGKECSRTALIVAWLFGMALAAFSWFPMLARTDSMLDLGLVGRPLEEIGKRVIWTATFERAWGPLTVLAFVGAIGALLRRVPGAFFFAVGTGLFVLLSSDLPTAVLHLERVTGAVVKIEAERMVTIAKLLWFPLIGYALSLPFQGLSAHFGAFVQHPMATLRRLVGNRWNLVWLGCLVVLLPIAQPALREFARTQSDHPYALQKDVQHWRDLQPFFAYAREQRKQSQEHYRIAYAFPMHLHLMTLSPVFTQTPMYKIGYTPSHTFTAMPMTGEPELLRQLSVKFVLTDGHLPKEHFTLDRVFGSLKLYRFNQFTPEPFTVLGEGSGELLEFSPETIRIRLRGTAALSRLKVHVAITDHWQATLNGQEVPILPATILGNEYPFLMEMPAADGELVLRYVARRPDLLAASASWAAVPLLFVGVYLRRRRPAWLRRFPAPSRRVLVGIAAAALVLGAVGFTLRWQARAALLPRDSLFRHIQSGQLSLDGAACEADGPWSFRCGNSRVEAKLVGASFGASGAGQNHTCMTTGSRGMLQISIKGPLPALLSGRYDPQKDGSGRINVWVDDEPLGRIRSRPPDLGQQFLLFDTRPLQPTESKTLRIEVTGATLNCFDFAFLPAR